MANTVRFQPTDVLLKIILHPTIYPGMNCVSLVMLLFVRQIKTIYLLKLDNQAVDKKNTEDSPCANVNYINLCILCYDCLDLPGRPKTSKVRRRWANDGNDQKTT